MGFYISISRAFTDRTQAIMLNVKTFFHTHTEIVFTIEKRLLHVQFWKVQIKKASSRTAIARVVKASCVCHRGS